MGNRSSDTLGFAVSMMLFTVFALFLMLVLLTGASSFRSVSSVIEERYSERTALLYVSQKVRMCDRENGVNITEIDGVRALVLNSYYIDNFTGNKGDITIYIYEKDGYLNELYTFGDEEPQLRLGMRLLPAESAEFEMISRSLLKININDSDILVKINAGGSE